jgi:iron complex outermembrane recepter protein
MNELYSRGLHHGAASYEIGDSTITFEQAWNSSLSLQYKGHGKFTGELGTYYNYIHDFIYQEPTQPATLTVRGAFPTFIYKQVDARFMGVDAAFSWNITDRLRWSGKASIVRAQNLTLDQPLIFIPPDRFESGLGYEFVGGKVFHAPTLSVSGVFTRHQNRYPIGLDYADPPQAWALLNAEINTTVTLGHFTMDVNAGCYNITNTRYRDYMNRFRYYAGEMGRNYTVRIKIPFSFSGKKDN